jgi:hypothetical protein
MYLFRNSCDCQSGGFSLIIWQCAKGDNLVAGKSSISGYNIPVNSHSQAELDGCNILPDYFSGAFIAADKKISVNVWPMEERRKHTIV